MAKITSEGPGSTGFWTRTYRLDTGYEFVVSRGTPKALPDRADREWMGSVLLQDEPQNQLLEELESQGALQGLASWATVHGQRVMVVKEGRLEEVAEFVADCLRDR